MENNFDNTPDSNKNSSSQYTDPNAGYQYYQGDPQNSGNQDWNQNNYNYNVGGNMGYNQPQYGSGMDESPMSLGDWVLTILASFIPCAGIILYFVWAFGKNGNVNRRNYCRASLIIGAVVIILYLLVIAVFGVAVIGSYN